jgi:putative hydrolase of the HAD superfamily
MPKLTWLFDLDNTLHNASHAIFPAITANMNVYIAKVLEQNGMAATPEAVNAARLAYWQRYGATLLGMVRHHQVRVDDFLHEAHQFDDLATMIRAMAWGCPASAFMAWGGSMGRHRAGPGVIC